MRAPRTLIVALMVLGLAGCQSGKLAPKLDAERAQLEDLRRLVSMLDETVQVQRRLGTVSHRLTVAGAEICGDRTRPYYGINLIGHPRDVARLRHRDIYRQAFGLGDGFTIVDLTADGPAAEAGLRAGDVVVALAGEPVVGPADAGRLSRLFGGAGGRLAIDIARDGATEAVEIAPVSECAQDVRLAGGNAVAIDALAGPVLVTPGMVRFAVTDDELAVVVAHALARALLDPAPRSAATVAVPKGVTSAIGSAAGVRVRPIDIEIGDRQLGAAAEAKADQLGLYLAARAGFDVSHAARFWRRLAVAHPRAVHGDRTGARPGLAKRLAAIEQTVRDIATKQRDGAALLPAGVDLPVAAMPTEADLVDLPSSVRDHAIIAARQSREPFQRFWGRARSVQWVEQPTSDE